MFKKLWEIFFGKSSKGKTMIPWGNRKLGKQSREHHFYALGAQGSGKTRLIRHMMETLFPLITPDASPPHRAFVYDVKPEYMKFLYAYKEKGIIHPDTRIIPLHPIKDRRSWGWDIAAELNAYPENIREQPAGDLANEFILKDSSTKESEFFADFARILLKNGMLHLDRHCTDKNDWGYTWSLYDLLQIASDPHYQQQLAENTGSQETYDNIRVSLDTKLNSLKFVAQFMALAQQQPTGELDDEGKPIYRSFTLRDWMRSTDILIIRGHKHIDSGITALNRVFFSQLVTVLTEKDDLNATHENYGYTWVWFDEVLKAGPLSALPEFCEQCRSKGGTAILGFQSIPGLHLLYQNTNIGKHLLELVGNRAVLRVGPETAKFAAEVFGEKQQGINPQTGEPIIVQRYPAQTFKDIPECSPQVGVQGFFSSPGGKYWQTSLRHDLIPEHMTTPNLGNNFWPGDAYPEENPNLSVLKKHPEIEWPQKITGDDNSDDTYTSIYDLPLNFFDPEYDPGEDQDHD